MRKLSLVMIVKNEEKVLARCLDSVKHLVDEMIVADTGSTDDTKKLLTLMVLKYAIMFGRMTLPRPEILR